MGGGELGRLIMLTNRLKDSLASPIARSAVQSPGLVIVAVKHPSALVVDLSCSYLKDIIH